MLNRIHYNTVLNAVPAPDGKEKVIAEYQTIPQIISELLFCFKKYNYQASEVARKYYTGNFKTDAHNIWQFIKDNIQYNAEPFEHQTSRSFSRIVHDKEGDCKHNTLLASSIAWQMGYDVIFRFVKYELSLGGKKDFIWHTYVVLVDPKTGERIVVDPLQDFNYEKPRVKEINFIAQHKQNNMTLTRLSGTDFMQVEPAQITAIDVDGQREIILTSLVDKEGGEMGKVSLKKAVKKVASKSKAIVKEAKKEIKQTGKAAKKAVKKAGGVVKKKVLPGVKKVALAPVRLAMDGLILINFRNFATRLKKGIEKDPNKVKSFSDKFGFKWENFKSTVNKGANKKPIFQKVNGMDIIDTGEGIGFVLSASAVATAAPAVIALIPLLKALGLGAETDSTDVKAAADDISKIPDVEGSEDSTTEEIIQESSASYPTPFIKQPPAKQTQQLPAKQTQQLPAQQQQEEEEVEDEKKSAGGFMQIVKNYPIPVLLFTATTVYLVGKGLTKKNK